MKPTVKRIIIIVLGWFFIVLGIAGLFLPVVQGILFLLIGFYLLSHESRWARKLLDKMMTRYPAVGRQFYKLKEKNRRLFKKIFGK